MENDRWLSAVCPQYLSMVRASRSSSDSSCCIRRHETTLGKDSDFRVNGEIHSFGLTFYFILFVISIFDTDHVHRGTIGENETIGFLKRSVLFVDMRDKYVPGTCLEHRWHFESWNRRIRNNPSIQRWSHRPFQYRPVIRYLRSCLWPVGSLANGDNTGGSFACYSLVLPFSYRLARMILLAYSMTFDFST